MDDTASNRRKYSRQPISLSALVHPQQGRSWLCSIRDFCEEGMLLTGGSGSRALSSTGAQAKPGDVVALHFTVATPSSQEHFRTQAKIARLTDSGNSMGVIFENGIEQRALDTLMDFAVAAGTTVPADFGETGDESADGKAASAKSKSPNGSMRASEEIADRGLRDRTLPTEAADKLKTRIRTVAE